MLDIYDILALTWIIDKMSNSKNPVDYKDSITQIFSILRKNLIDKQDI